MKRYLKRSILVHHGLNDKTRIVSGTAVKAVLANSCCPSTFFVCFFEGAGLFIVINLSNITILTDCINLKNQHIKNYCII